MKLAGEPVTEDRELTEAEPGGLVVQVGKRSWARIRLPEAEARPAWWFDSPMRNHYSRPSPRTPDRARFTGPELRSRLTPTFS